MLHIINKSPFQTSTLESCLRIAQPGHALLFIEDGVYGATSGTALAERVRAAAQTIKIFALQPDLEARGVATRLLEGVGTVDYGGFVDLTTEYSTVHSWL